MDLTELYKTQISFSEWFEKIQYANKIEFRTEDNEKRERLAVLNRIIGLPFDKATNFPAIEVAEQSDSFRKFLLEHGEELCALRLVPYDPKLPKLRMRGHKIKDVLEWFHKQNVDPIQYRADFVPHSEHSLWSTIFVVNQNGIFGEIIEGGHHQLTQGFHEHELITFSFDFKNWELSGKNDKALHELKKIVDHLYVPQKEKQRALKHNFNSAFAHDYLCGYFETVTTADRGLWFIDYNRILGNMYKDFSLSHSRTGNNSLLQGQSTSTGKVRGKVRIVKNTSAYFEAGDILVCTMTSPDYVPLMQKASAIITNQGGILSHAAIISREMQKPCIIGTKIATEVLKDGDEIEVDADRGIITRII